MTLVLIPQIMNKIYKHFAFSKVLLKSKELYLFRFSRTFRQFEEIQSQSPEPWIGIQEEFHCFHLYILYQLRDNHT